MDKELVGMAFFIGIVCLLLLWMYPKIESISNGGPSFPEECTQGFTENVTYGGQVITSYPWSNKCCTKRYVGYEKRNNYKKICWEKNDANVGSDAYEVDDE